MTRKEMEIRADRLFRDLVSALKQQRTEKELSQRELSDRSGVAQAFISEMECGKATPTWHCLSRLCDSLETTIPALIIRVVLNGKKRSLADRLMLSELATLMGDVAKLDDSSDKARESTLTATVRNGGRRKQK